MDAERFSSKIIFVTGKGGVGKSTVAAALALKNAREGKKTLLVELGDRSYLSFGSTWGEASSRPRPTPLGFDMALWRGVDCLREYVLHYIKIQTLANLFFENRIMSSFLNIAPALNELALLGKITSQERGVGPAMNYDCLVVDTFATGHALALFRAPLGMAQAIQQGPMGRESQSIHKILSQEGLTEFVIVGTPEELPIDESLELRAGLAELYPQSPSFILNKVELSHWGDSELEGLRQSSGLVAENQWSEYLWSKKKWHRPYIEKARAEFPEVVEIPLIFSSSLIEVVRSMEDVLSKH